MFVEFITNSKTNRFNILPIGEVDPFKVRNFEAYASLMPYDREILDHMKATRDHKHPKGNVSGYAGKVFCRWIYWDFDGGIGEILHPYMDAKRLANHLVTKYAVPSNDLAIFFSGGKGFHVGISSAHVGGIDPMPAEGMAHQLATFTERIIDDHPAVMESFDSGLYAVNRYFRLPNSRHASTNLYKIPLSFDELMELRPENILKLAAAPRPDFQYQFSKKVLPKKEIQKAWSIVQAGEVVTEAAREALAALPTDEKGLFDVAVKLAHEKYSKADYFAGNKNNFTFYLAAWLNDLGIGKAGDGARALELIRDYRENVLKDDPATWDDRRIQQTVENAYSRLRRKHGSKRNFLRKSSPSAGGVGNIIALEDEISSLSRSLRPKQLLRVALAINASSKAPAPEADVQNLVLRHVRGGAGFTSEDMPKPIYHFADPFIEKAQRTANSKGIGIPAIDAAENFDYEGKVGQVIGMGGVGKSIFLKDLCMYASTNGERAYYSTMEDTALRLFERVIRADFSAEYKIDPETGEVFDYISAIKRLTELARHDGKTLREALNRFLRQKYGDYFLIDERVGMDKKAYIETVEWLLNKYGMLNILAIDGLSTMASTGRGEVDAAIQNSFDVKELANTFKLFVPVLVHTPGGVDREARNLWDFTRGGVKVMQNADFFIALSNIQDEENSVPGDVTYFQDKMFLKYWGKRTSGQFIEIIMELDKETLQWKPTDKTLDDVKIDVF